MGVPRPPPAVIADKRHRSARLSRCGHVPCAAPQHGTPSVFKLLARGREQGTIPIRHLQSVNYYNKYSDSDILEDNGGGRLGRRADAAVRDEESERACSRDSNYHEQSCWRAIGQRAELIPVWEQTCGWNM